MSSTAAKTPLVESNKAEPATTVPETLPEIKTATGQKPLSAIEPLQPKSAPVPSSATSVTASVPAAVSSQKPAEPDSPVTPGPVTPKAPPAPSAPAPAEFAAVSNKPAPPPVPKKLVGKSEPEPAHPQIVPKETAPAIVVQPAPPQILSKETAPAPTVQSAPIQQPPAPTPTPAVQVAAPTPTPTVQVAAQADTETPALVSNPQPPIASPKPKAIGSPRIAVSKDAKEAPRQTVAIVDHAPPQVVQPSPLVPVPVTEGAVAPPDTPETPVKPRAATPVATAPTTVAEPTEAPLSTTAENLAFAVHMLPAAPVPVHKEPVSTKPAITDGASDQESPVDQPKPAVSLPKPIPQVRQDPTPSNSRRETASPDRGPDPAPDKSSPRVTKSPDLLQPAPTRGITTQWTEVTASRPSDFNSSSSLSPEPVEPGHVSAAIAAQESHVVLPELPKAPTSTDILLHLTGNDHSPAAIRVAERAGSVNVSVHTSDPVLRESLRSNLGELSSQLSGQGWKADVVKPASVAAQPESQQDSHASREGSSQQQQSFGGDRQPQRDRRTPGQWQQEFEQQTASGDARPGGTR